MLTNLGKIAKKNLLTYYNHIWDNQVIPKEWKHAIVIPIPKPGKDQTKPDNYRPISLTSCMCKLLEKIINARLNWVFKEKKIITPTQCGSQPGKSTVDSLAQLEDYIRKNYLRKQATIAVMFDLVKAYDTIWRRTILENMKKQQLTGNLPGFIQEFLKERTFQVRLQGEFSETLTLENGIPQGSVLSSSLFALGINNIIKALPKGIRNSLYVDDFCVYFASKNPHHTKRLLNKAIKS